MTSVDATMLLRYTLAGAAHAMVRRGKTGSKESTSGGVMADALAARGRDDDNDVDGAHMGEHGPGP